MQPGSAAIHCETQMRPMTAPEPGGACETGSFAGSRAFFRAAPGAMQVQRVTHSRGEQHMVIARPDPVCHEAES